MKTIPYEDIKARLLQKPGFREAYDALAPEFELAQTIIAARAARGLTQAELAARMETSQSYIARLESGRVLPSMRTWQRLAAATGTRPKFTLEPLPGR
ncbi:MAG: helix-turn-helix transcriptional regulator [Candidatus Competibacteraceae bacterium]|nr:helix-turn-helix transcriptional regulator [Candidatus Competibacteraceae bacterium]